MMILAKKGERREMFLLKNILEFLAIAYLFILTLVEACADEEPEEAS